MVEPGGRGRDGEGAGAEGRGSFLPSFCGIGAAFAVVLGGELLVLVLVLAGGGPAGDFWERLSLLSLYVQWVGLAGAAALCLLGRVLARWPHWLAGLAAWGLFVGVTGLTGLGLHWWSGLNLALPGLAGPGGLELIARSLGVSGIVAALVLRYLYLDHQWRLQVVARSEARFQALQARIRPHFLFNSMNTVASLTRTDPARAEAVVEDLADLFRAALGDQARGSTLGEELELIRRYLEVEQLRLDQRLRVEWDLEELPEEAPLPLLVLQPLVENAVYHGVEPSPTGGVVRIAGRYRGTRVNISVRNTLAPPQAAPGHREGNRMALDNVRQRLAAMYGEGCSLTLGRVDQEFQVRVVFPYP